MKKLAKCAFALDLSGALCLCAAMIYFFIYSVSIFPALAAYKGDTGSALGNTTAAFGIALGVAVIAALLAIAAAIGLIFGAFATATAVINFRQLSKKGKVTGSYMTLSIISTVLQLIACAGAMCLYTPHAAFIPVLVLCPVCVILAAVCWIFKAKCRKADIPQPM